MFFTDMGGVNSCCSRTEQPADGVPLGHCPSGLHSGCFCQQSPVQAAGAAKPLLFLPLRVLAATLMKKRPCLADSAAAAKMTARTCFAACLVLFVAEPAKLEASKCAHPLWLQSAEVLT